MVTLLSGPPLALPLSALPLWPSSEVLLPLGNASSISGFVCSFPPAEGKEGRPCQRGKKNNNRVCLRVMDKVMAIFSSYLLEGYDDMTV